MLNYNAPKFGAETGSSGIDVGQKGSNKSEQMQSFYWLRKAIITARKEQYFSQLASVTAMPKHFGKTIKVYEYVPLLDDRNVNDQGIDAKGAKIADGNLYGSSKDVGVITAKLPTLTENGGRVNRVGFTRIQREGSLHKFGFFTEFTQESLDFDSDEQLMDHLATELMNGAVQMSEAQLQMDLLAAAGVQSFPGAATAIGEVDPAASTDAGLVSYKQLMRLDQTLTDNRTPRQTKIITGSKNIDTRVIPSGRVLYVGSELVPVLRGMKDLFDQPAFIPVQQYADAGTLLNGEIGSIDQFRIVQVPEMLHWAGKGKTGADTKFRITGGKYDVFPLLCVGDQSFTTIGFQTNGSSGKFSVLTKMPGRETADRNDPYGETGFSTIKWYYGFLALRPERIAVAYSGAPV